MKSKIPKYFGSLLFFALFLCIIPISIIGIFSYQMMSSLVNNNVIESQKQVLSQNCRRLEEMLKIVDNSVGQFVAMPGLELLLSVPRDEHYFVEFEKLYQYLYRMQTFNATVTVADLLLVNFDQDWILSNSRNDPLSSVPGIRELSQQWRDYPGTTFWKATPPVVNMDNLKYHLTNGAILMKKIPVRGNVAGAMLIVNVPQSELNRLLELDERNYKMVVVDGDNRLVFHYDPNLIGSDFSSQLKKFKKAGQNDNHFLITKVDRVRTAVISQHSTYNNWTYYRLIPANEIFAPVSKQKYVTLAVLALVCIAFILLAIYGSNFLYKPVKFLFDMVVLKGRSVAPAVESGEFNLITKVIGQIIENNDQLQTQLLKQGRLVKSFILRRALQGEIARENVGESFKAYGIQSKDDYLAIIGVEIDKTPEINAHEHDKQLIIFAMGKILQEMTKSALEPVLIDDQYYLLIGSCDNKNNFEAQLEITAKTIIAIIQEHLKVIVSVAISSIFSDVSQIGRAKSESQQALKYRIRPSEGLVIFADSLKNDPGRTDDKSDELQINIEYLLKSFEYDKAYHLICEYIDNIQNDDYSTFQIKLTGLFLNLYAIIAQICPASINSDSNTSIIEDLLQIKATNNLKKWFYNKIIEPLAQYVLSGGNEVFRNRIARNAVNYVLQNLERDISLESCANHFNYSRSYLSKVFKSEIGMSFSEYLIKERINLAQKLLCETDLNINDIAAKTCYNNAQNFIRVFKKSVGMTPGQYRRKQELP